MTFPIGAPLARTTIPVTLIAYTLNGTMFVHPCDSADEHVEFFRGMRDAYPNVALTVYEQATVEDGPPLIEVRGGVRHHNGVAVGPCFAVRGACIYGDLCLRERGCALTHKTRGVAP